jgi:hypothetical protein
MKKALSTLGLISMLCASAQAQQGLTITLQGNVSDIQKIEYWPRPLANGGSDRFNPVTQNVPLATDGLFTVGDAVTVSFTLNFPSGAPSGGSLALPSTSLPQATGDSIYFRNNSSFQERMLVNGQVVSLLNVNVSVPALASFGGAIPELLTTRLSFKEGSMVDDSPGASSYLAMARRGDLLGAQSSLWINGTCNPIGQTPNNPTEGCEVVNLSVASIMLSTVGDSWTSAVPEASTVAMWALGLLGIGIAAARKNRA